MLHVFFLNQVLLCFGLFVFLLVLVCFGLVVSMVLVWFALFASFVSLLVWFGYDFGLVCCRLFGFGLVMFGVVVFFNG